MPAPKNSEKKSEYISRCMSSKEARKSFPNQKQRVAFCNSNWGRKTKASSGRMQELLDSLKETLGKNA